MGGTFKRYKLEFSLRYGSLLQSQFIKKFDPLFMINETEKKSFSNISLWTQAPLILSTIIK